MGHHQQWVGGERSPEYFGIDPDASDALTAVMTRRPALVAYTAGHTHRHRVRLRRPAASRRSRSAASRTSRARGPSTASTTAGSSRSSTASSSPEALAWSEQCRTLYSDFGVDYAPYALGTLGDRCFAIPLR